MIPYSAVLEFFISFFNAIPLPIRAFFLTAVLLSLGLDLFIAFVKWIFG